MHNHTKKMSADHISKDIFFVFQIILIPYQKSQTRERNYTLSKGQTLFQLKTSKQINPLQKTQK